MYQKAHSEKIELPKNNSDIIKYMILYIYIFDYKNEEYKYFKFTVSSTSLNDETAETINDERQILFKTVVNT